jgi:hypothetical protein
MRTKKKTRKSRTNKSAKRRRTRTLMRKRSNKYQRRGAVRGGVGPDERSKIGRFFLLYNDGNPNGFRPLYLTTKELEDGGILSPEENIEALSIPPIYPPEPTDDYIIRLSPQYDIMPNTAFNFEVEIVNINKDVEGYTLSGRVEELKKNYTITIPNEWIVARADIWEVIKSNYGLFE